jgi:hypothetical protein
MNKSKVIHKTRGILRGQGWAVLIVRPTQMVSLRGLVRPVVLN